ncbi:sphingoid long chain base kinase-like protein [Xylaria sp. FL1777]|nr:sphingoid long chain base kinase-like protein [Xylaria sp. FL1777]
MAESDPVAPASGSAASNAELSSAETATQTHLEPVLFLEGNVTLIMGSNGLAIEGATDFFKRHQQSRVCGVSTGKLPVITTIPYYDILWASIDTELVIDYVTEKSTTKFRCARLTYTLGDATIVKSRAFVEAILSHAYGQAQRQRRAKVLINPHAGPGGAIRLWEHDVKPIFEAARMTLDVVTTSRGGEGTEICEALDIDAYDVVVVCSGDGLAYEVFNGFGKRADARTALQKVAVAHIPCGSGNAMSCNLNGSHHPGPSALAVVKGVRTSMDLMSVTQGSERMLSFLSQSVGIIAEADLGTENMRWLGAARFDIGVAQRIFGRKVYPCDIAIKVEIENKSEVKAHYKRIQDGEQGQEQEGLSTSSSHSKHDAGEGLPPLRFGTVNDSIPQDWQVASYDKLGNFYCGNMAWVAPTANFFPGACINDGLMDVVTNDGDIPILKYANLMRSVETGKFFDNPLASYRKVVAYRFTPRNQTDGYISIDGERIPFKPFQVEIHPGLATVLSKTGRYEAYGPPGWKESV